MFSRIVEEIFRGVESELESENFITWSWSRKVSFAWSQRRKLFYHDQNSDQNKVIFKKGPHFRGATFKCSKTVCSLKKSYRFRRGHFLVSQNKVVSKKSLF